MKTKFGKDYYRRKICRSCSGKNLKLVLHHEPTPLGEEYLSFKKKQDFYPVDVFMCQDCKLLQLLDIVDPEILYRDYVYISTLSLGLNKHFVDYAKSVSHKLELPKGSLTIDIGSNDGLLLKALSSVGMKVLGVDPAVEIAKEVTKQGYETIPDFFGLGLAKEIRKKYGPARLVTSNNTMANVDALSGFIEGVKVLLDRDGVFIVEAGYALDVIQNTIIDNIYHEHLSIFSVKSLQNLFNLHGMELIDVDRTHMKGGSIRVYAQLKDGPRSKSTSVEELLSLEESMGLYELEIFNKFNKRVEEESKRIIKILKKAKSQKKIVAGYGASVGATVLLHNLKIGKYIDFIVDEYKPKQNLFSPNFHIPTYSPEEIIKKKPDYIINLAWRYAVPVIKKNPNFKGKFITPFSEVGE